MCDTWVALGDCSLSKNIIFAKNSDRPIHDCQPLLFRPRQDWPANSKVQTEYIELPQVELTYAHLGSSPYWSWGYEEGINEYSLVIGNEAIFTKTFRESVDGSPGSHDEKLGLLGMDLIRLALERSQTALQAVELMGNLIEQYGQYGSSLPGKLHPKGSYDNSFILADPMEAWVLETAGCRWVAKRIVKGFASISNQPSIRLKWDLGSFDVKDYALQKAWWPEENRNSFDFARAYTDDNVSRQVSQIRMMRSQHLLSEKDGQITPQWMMRIARDHYEDTFLHGPYFDAADPDFLSLCMHVSPAAFTWGNTASSCVAVLPKSETDLPVLWWTPGPPCNGCYVPFFVHGSKLPEIVSQTGLQGKSVTPPDQAEPDQFSPDSYWWLFRELMDRVKGDPVKSLPDHYPARNRIVREWFDPLEQEFEAEIPRVISKAVELRNSDPEAAAHTLGEFTEACVKKVFLVVESLLREFEGNPESFKA